MEDPYISILNHCDYILSELGLRTFLIKLPLNSSIAKSTGKGIKQKIFKNLSFSSIKIDQDNIIQKNNGYYSLNMGVRDMNLCRYSNSKYLNKEDLLNIENIVKSLTEPTICGFVFLIAEISLEDKSSLYNSNTSSKCYRPIGGGIVELVDDYERCLRSIFCKKKLPLKISENILRIIIGRTIIHALQWKYNNSKKKCTNKVISVLDDHIKLFPIPAYNILLKDLPMSKHWEIYDDAGSHSDHPGIKCNCYKLSNFPNSRQFWGISESRFMKLIKSDPKLFGKNLLIEDFLSDNYFKSNKLVTNYNEKQDKENLDNIYTKKRKLLN
ncbi:hypothetical protein cand_016530 [Cryptosporidium andersoni]|uniref:Uncharacterized protein n=1 Tax=Cryptosporidium andersoni TaxID=117008 RepID=A0A1J4MX50_9CRYT|nr:hypothetical protein cand_016530 [Cryptosporidium andersoni]